MKRAKRPFMVEVRGGRRPSPLDAMSPAPRAAMSDAALNAAIREAEAALFYRGPTPELFGDSDASAAPRRILQDLAQVEQPLPDLEEPEPPKLRGRRPGSKNKPKLPLFVAALPAEATAPTPPIAQARNGSPSLEIPKSIEDDLHEPVSGSLDPQVIQIQDAPASQPQSRLRKPGASLLRTIMSRYVFVQKATRGEDWKRRIVQRY